MDEQNTTYVKKALYLHGDEDQAQFDELTRFSPDIDITSIDIDVFLASDHTFDPGIKHLVVCAPLAKLKAVMEIAIEQKFSLGVLPAKNERQLCGYIGVSADNDERISLALQQNQQPTDVVRCNGHIVLFSATMGRVLIAQSKRQDSWILISRRFFSDLRRIRLLGFKFTLPGKKPIDTAASGCVIVTPNSDNFSSRLIAADANDLDGMVSLLIAAPASVMGFLSFLYRVLKGHITIQKIPDTLAYIKTPKLTIEASKILQIDIDGQTESKTPAKCEVQPLALKINKMPNTKNSTRVDTSECIDLHNLPMGAEKIKAMKKKIPFFPYATEERFKDLFILLRQDARSDTAYLVLMILSTMLATVGLYLDSSSVIIGAMLLAPLMAPIVSLSMGILRSDQSLLFQSARTIFIGIVIALAASAMVTWLLPNTLITSEMSARLNPSLLDLAVAIFAGIAAAYTKSNKEMLSGLAGVAIAVALVPPLAVAGVGLGRADPVFFGQAFLLFTTNLIGITVAAALTFRLLGYSAAIKAKKSFIYVIIILALISIPLYFSFQNIVDKVSANLAWKKERYLVNGKYLIVSQATRYKRADFDVIEMEIYSRDNLSRKDLDAFKAKIKNASKRKLVIRANLIYIL